MSLSKGEVLRHFWEMNRRGVDAEGIRIPQAIGALPDGKLGCYAMAMFGPETGLDTFKAVARILIKERPAELVFGLDRFAKPDQGIRTRDFLSVHYWDGDVWRFGVIAYQHEPPIFDPIDWGNAQWVEMLREEATRIWTNITAAPHAVPSPAMQIPLRFDRFNQPPPAAAPEGAPH